MPRDYRDRSAPRPRRSSDDDFVAHVREAVGEFGRVPATGEAWDTFIGRVGYVAAAPTTRATWPRRSRRRRASWAPAPRPALPGGPAGRLGRDRRRARRRRARRARRAGDPREAVRHRPRLGRGAQRDAARGLRRGADLPHRPLPRQGGGAEHPRAAVRQRAVRADLEPRPHRLRPDRRARDARRSGAARGFYERHRRVPRHGRHAPVPVLGFMAMEPPAALSAEALREEKTRCSRRCRPLDPAKVVRGQYEGYRDEPGVDPRVRHGDVRRGRGRDRQLALGRRAVLPAHRQVAGRVGARVDHARLPRAADADVPHRGRSTSGGNQLVFELGEPGAITADFQAKEPGPTMALGRRAHGLRLRASRSAPQRSSRPTSG